MRNPFAPAGIYPKYALAEWAIPEKRGFCFVICPFERKYTPVYRTIQKAARDAGFPETYRVDDPPNAGTAILGNVLRGIQIAQMIVADVSGANANVFYELGVCHMVKDPDQVLLIAQDRQLPRGIKFDVCHVEHLGYNRSVQGLATLASQLAELLRRKTKERKAETRRGHQWP